MVPFWSKCTLSMLMETQRYLPCLTPSELKQTLITLEIYDGGDMQSKLLANFSGASLPENTLKTSGNQMTMRFITDGAMQYFGWHMIWNTN
ncbi:hypothetical protein COOONC_15912 [Cooperia oncophora]